MSTKAEKAVQTALPGWKVVHHSAPADAHTTHRSGSSSVKADATSPTLRAVKTKIFGKKQASSPTSAAAKKPSSVEFVTVVPENFPDNARTFQKTVVCEDGEVIAIQG